MHKKVKKLKPTPIKIIGSVEPSRAHQHCCIVASTNHHTRCRTCVVTGKEKKAPISEHGVEPDDELLLLRREGAALEVRAEVVDPAEAAALAAALQAGVPGHVGPRPLPAPQHVRHQLLVLLRRPQTLAQLRRSRRALRLPH
jgi:hypothetical protein